MQQFFFLWGSGANGKSVLLDIMRDILCDYGITMKTSAHVCKTDMCIGQKMLTWICVMAKGCRLNHFASCRGFRAFIFRSDGCPGNVTDLFRVLGDLFLCLLLAC